MIKKDYNTGAEKFFNKKPYQKFLKSALLRKNKKKPPELKSFKGALMWI